MAHAPAQSRALDAACREWRRLLGSKAVLNTPEILARYAATTLADAPAPVAVVRPTGCKQVPEVVRVANAHRVPLYPISRGKNWGWGDACPVTEGQVILEVSCLDRIVEVDEELGYAVVQPGVTQSQLANHLRAAHSSWWLDWTAAGPDTSVLGNVLERGITSEERAAQAAGMQVVLGDGTTVRTGYGHFSGTRVAHLSRWGVGPALDGLFTQSNLAVVTELGIWLQPRPAHAELGYIAVPDAGLEAAIDALRPLRMRGVLGGQPMFLAPAVPAVWFGPVVLQGHPAAVAAYREELARLVPSPAAVAFPTPETASDAGARTATLAELALPPLPFFDTMLRRRDPLAPPAFSPESVLAFVGGPLVQHPNGAPVSADPLENGYGFYFVWLTCPAVGREVRRLLDVVRPRLTTGGYPPLMSLRFATGRAIV